VNLSGSGKQFRSGTGAALRIAIIYALIALAWILGSDWLLQKLLPEATIKLISRFQSLKGATFVLVTASLLYMLIRSAVREIHATQNAMQLSEDRFRRLVEHSPSGIFVHLNGEFIYANSAMARILGCDDPKSLIGTQNLDLIHPDDQAIVRERMRIIREQRMAVGLQEQRMRRHDGSYVWVDVAAIPFDIDGQPGTQVLVLDISARKKAEEELRQLNETLEKRVAQRTVELQQALDDLRTFSYMISHDLRTPLAGIRRFGEQVLSGAGVQSDPETQDAARRIIAMSVRLDRLTQDLFEYNKLARAEIQLQRISSVLVAHEVLGQLRRDPAFADAQINVREPMPWVLTHRSTLALVLQNLVLNALQHVPADRKPIIDIYAQDLGTAARIIVQDNGVGLDPQQCQGIFHLFEQPRPQNEISGSGIGLAIVRRGVERLGGHVGVESTPGAGSRFWIELPKDPDSP
jgi:PAS domain S-box-containing protein